MRRLLPALAVLLWAPRAQAFTLVGFNHDWFETEEHCTYNPDNQPACTASGTSNDTAAAAFDLGTLAPGEYFDSARPPADSTIAEPGSEAVTLSHGNSTLGDEFLDTFITSVFVHSAVVDTLDVDTDWYTVTPDADLCLEVCLLPRPLADEHTVQADWTLTVSTGAADALEPLATITGIGCESLYTDGATLHLAVEDPTPEIVFHPSGGLSGQYYRLVVSNEDGSTGSNWYPDVDGDGYGDGSAEPTFACEAPTASDTTNAEDCDDVDPTQHPGAPEVCNGEDDDCDETPDEGLSLWTWYPDDDEDGYGAIDSEGSQFCADPGTGWSGARTDCDDEDENQHPTATEVCNDEDDDCDGLVDDELVYTTWYEDVDGDGAGDPETAVSLCADPGDGWSTTAGDCADGDENVGPGVTETCNEVDDDCDGEVDEGLDVCFWWPDTDGDGHGDADAEPTAGCAPPAETGWAADGLDCDDDDEDTSPSATETCNGADDDCDGLVDDGVTTRYYADDDGDGHGDPATFQDACASPGAAWVLDAKDCAPADAAVSPEASEACNDVDDDCDGLVDEGACDEGNWEEASACGCATGTPPPLPWLGLAVLLVLRRRKGGAA